MTVWVRTVLKNGVFSISVSVLICCTEVSAENLPALGGAPVLIGAGRSDPIARPDQTERLTALLREAGADVTLHWDAGGHTLGSPEVAAAREWLSTIKNSRSRRPVGKQPRHEPEHRHET